MKSKYKLVGCVYCPYCLDKNIEHNTFKTIEINDVLYLKCTKCKNEMNTKLKRKVKN